MKNRIPLCRKILVVLLLEGGFQQTMPLLQAQPCAPTWDAAADGASPNVVTPSFLNAWTARYPTSTLPARMNSLTGRTCNACHNPISFSEPGNCYRQNLATLLGQGLSIEQAIDQLDTIDSDGDGFTNGQEATMPRPELGEVGYNMGLIGPTGTDPCATDPNATVTNVAETPPGPPIPAVSDWGLIAATLSLAVAGSLVLRRRSDPAA